MTIAEIAAQMGVTPETLVQEVIARESVKFQWLVILGALAIGLSIFILLACVKRDRLDCMENRSGNHGEPVYCRILWRWTE